MAKRTKSYQGGKYRVESMNAGGALTTNDFGKVLTVNDTTGTVTITLPQATAEWVGSWIRVEKQGAAIVQVTADAADVIGDSGTGSSARNESTETYAFMELLITGVGRWALSSTVGAWYST